MMGTEMAAGRELDAEIARRVFGYFVGQNAGAPEPYIKRTARARLSRMLPHYSTDIAEAWPVFAWIVDRYDWAEIYMEVPSRCQILVSDFAYHRVHEVPEDICSERCISGGDLVEAPLAICRAALAALEGKGA